MRQGTESLPELALFVLAKPQNGPALTASRSCSSGRVIDAQANTRGFCTHAPRPH